MAQTVKRARGFKLTNDGGFVVSIHALYTDETANPQDKPISGNFPIGQSETALLNQCPGLAEGDWVRLKIWIQAGDDRTGSPSVRYDPNGPIQCWKISGATLNSHVEYAGEEP